MKGVEGIVGRMRDVRDGFRDGRKERMGTERGKDKRQNIQLFRVTVSFVKSEH